MPQFFPLGADVPLRAWIPHRFTAYASAELTITRSGRPEPLLKETVNLVEGEVAKDEAKPSKARLATRKWPARDCLEDHEMSAVLDVEWKATGKVSSTTTRQQLVIYRDTVTVEAVRKGEGGEVAAGRVSFRCEMRRACDHEGQLKAFPEPLTTGPDGKAEITGLSPGDLMIEWRSPNVLAPEGWVTTGGFHYLGPKRKAVLSSTHRATFVSPKPSGGERVQRVNLPADAAKGHGTSVAIKVRVNPEDGPGRQGDALFLKLVWGAGNSPRETPGPKLDGKDLQKLRKDGKPHLVVQKKLAADDSEVEFVLDLGVAGGDTYEVFVGGTNACEDEGPLLIRTVRTLRLEPFFPPAFPNPEAIFDDTLKTMLTTSLASAGIELDIAPLAIATYTTEPGFVQYIPRRVTAEAARKIGWADRDHYVYTNPDYLFQCFPPGWNSVKPFPTLRAFFCDGCYTFGAKGTVFKFEGLTEATSKWQDGANGYTGFFPADLEGNSILMPVEELKPARDKKKRVFLFDTVKNDFVRSKDNRARKASASTHCWELEADTRKRAEKGVEVDAYSCRWVEKGAAAAGKRTVKVTVAAGAPAGAWEELDGRYCEQVVDGREAEVPAVWGKWRNSRGAEGVIEWRHIEIYDGKTITEKGKAEVRKTNLRFRLKLPAEAGASAANPVSAEVALRTVSAGVAGGSSSAGIILFVRAAKEKLAFAILHEIGHSLGHANVSKSIPGVPRQGPSTVPPGARVDYMYGSSVTTETANQRGHQGPHCAYGLDPKHRTSQTNYPKLLEDESLHGTCVMFGGVGPETVFTAESRKFCPNCLEHARAQDLSVVDGHYH